MASVSCFLLSIVPAFQFGQTIDQIRAERAVKGKQPVREHTEDEKDKNLSCSELNFVLLMNNGYTFFVMAIVILLMKLNSLILVGQLACYMDDLKCCYSIFTTHHKMWFVNRVTDDIFAVSNSIFGQDATRKSPHFANACFTLRCWQVMRRPRIGIGCMEIVW